MGIRIGIGGLKIGQGSTGVNWSSYWTTQGVAELIAYNAGLTTPLSTAQNARLETFIKALKTGLSITNLSDAFDVMYVLGGETAESSLRNLVKNAHYATAVNSPTFTQYEGFKGNGTSSYIDTNYNTKNEASAASVNSTALGIYSRTDVAEVKADIGAVTTATGAYGSMIMTRNILNEFIGAINMQNTGGTVGTNTNSTGMYILSRLLGTEFKGYKNKVAIGTPTRNSVLIEDAELFILCRSLGIVPNLFSNRQISFAFLGKGLNEAQAGVVTDAVEAYMDANGKGVIA